MDFGHQLWRHKHKECSRHGTSLRPPICIGKGCSSLGSDWRLLQSWIATTERDKMAGSHVYSRSPAIFLYFLLFSTCCEFMILHTYLSKEAFLRYVVWRKAQAHKKFAFTNFCVYNRLRFDGALV